MFIKESNVKNQDSDNETHFLIEKDFLTNPCNARNDHTTKWRFIEYFSLIIFAILQVFNPILVRIAHKESDKLGDLSFNGATTVFATEILKTIICCIVIPIKHRSFKKFFISVYQSFTVNKFETLKIFLPALIFVAQNNLYFFALQRIDATLFSVIYQLRLLTTAVLMMAILDKKFTYIQWLALLISLIGVITVQIGSHQAQPNNLTATNLSHTNISNQATGLTAVLIMCCTAAFGCVYLEAVMKKSNDDIFLQNIRLSLISLPMSAITMFSDYEAIKKNGFFSGWNFYVWLIIFTSSLGGIVVSSVIRYADNIKKSFCQALALGGTAFVSVYLGDSNFSFYLLSGVSLVAVSVILYATSSPHKLKNKPCFVMENECQEKNKTNT